MVFYKRLDEIGKIAQRPVVFRLLKHPVRLPMTFIHRNFIYPLKGTGLIREGITFFDKKMKVVLPAGTDLFLLGAKTHPSEIRLAKYLVKHLEEGDIFFDVGAHFGYYTLLASTLVSPKGKVVSFEPSTNTFRIFKNNLEKTQNVTPFNKAVGEEDGYLDFYEFPLLQSEYNTIDLDQYKSERWFEEGKVEKVRAEVVCLDSFIEKEKLIPDVIKIDVEGAELKVVNGIRKHLDKYSPTIILEYIRNDEPAGVNQHNQAADLLRSKGYSVFIINDGGELAEWLNFPEKGEIHIGESENLIFLKK